MRSIVTGSALAAPIATPRLRAVASRRASALSISAAVGTASSTASALAKATLLRAGDLAGDAARRGAVVEVDQTALADLAQNRGERLIGRGEARAHQAGDADIALEAAEEPVQAIDVLLGRQRGQQRLRAGIVVRIVERLHADLQQHLVAFAARARDPALEIGAVGRERKGDRRGQLGERLGGAVRSDAETLDHDRDARLVGAAGLRLDRARIDFGGRAPSGAIFGIAPWREVSSRRGSIGTSCLVSALGPGGLGRRRAARLPDRHLLTLAGRAVDDRDGLRARGLSPSASAVGGATASGFWTVEACGASPDLTGCGEGRVSALTTTIGSPPNGSSTNRIQPAQHGDAKSEHARDRRVSPAEAARRTASSSSASGRAAC